MSEEKTIEEMSVEELRSYLKMFIEKASALLERLDKALKEKDHE